MTCPRTAPPPHLSLAAQADAKLLQRAGEGDAQAFEALYDRYSATAFGLALRVCGDRGLAEEVTQDAFLALWRRPGSYDASRGELGSLLLTIVHHRAIDALRRETRHARRRTGEEQLASRAAIATGPQESALRADARGAAVRSLRQLPPEQRSVLALSYFGGLTHTEISDALGAPLGTVKSRMRAGLERVAGDIRQLAVAP